MPPRKEQKKAFVDGVLQLARTLDFNEDETLVGLITAVYVMCEKRGMDPIEVMTYVKATIKAGKPPAS